MHTHLKYAYAYLGYAHAFGVLEYMKGKLLDINSCRVNPTLFGSRLTPFYDHCKMPKKEILQRRMKYTEFTRKLVN